MDTEDLKSAFEDALAKIPADSGNKNVIEQLQIASTLLSEFDAVFTHLDPQLNDASIIQALKPITDAITYNDTLIAFYKIQIQETCLNTLSSPSVGEALFPRFFRGPDQPIDPTTWQGQEDKDNKYLLKVFTNQGLYSKLGGERLDAEANIWELGNYLFSAISWSNELPIITTRPYLIDLKQLTNTTDYASIQSAPFYLTKEGQPSLIEIESVLTNPADGRFAAAIESELAPWSPDTNPSPDSLFNAITFALLFGIRDISEDNLGIDKKTGEIKIHDLEIIFDLVARSENTTYPGIYVLDAINQHPQQAKLQPNRDTYEKFIEFTNRLKEKLPELLTFASTLRRNYFDIPLNQQTEFTESLQFLANIGDSSDDYDLDEGYDSEASDDSFLDDSTEFRKQLGLKNDNTANNCSNPTHQNNTHTVRLANSEASDYSFLDDSTEFRKRLGLKNDNTANNCSSPTHQNNTHTVRLANNATVDIDLARVTPHTQHADNSRISHAFNTPELEQLQANAERLIELGKIIQSKVATDNTLPTLQEFVNLFSPCYAETYEMIETIKINPNATANLSNYSYAKMLHHRSNSELDSPTSNALAATPYQERFSPEEIASIRSASNSPYSSVSPSTDSGAIETQLIAPQARATKSDDNLPTLFDENTPPPSPLSKNKKILFSNTSPFKTPGESDEQTEQEVEMAELKL